MIEALLVVLDGLSRVAQGSVSVAKVAQRSAFTSSIADLACNDEALLVVLDGLSRVTQGSVSVAKVAQRAAFTSSIADLTRNDDGACSWYSMAFRESPKSA